nr:MAG TPA: hypothetical protein [Caudoviricetes sp.]
MDQKKGAEGVQKGSKTQFLWGTVLANGDNDPQKSKNGPFWTLFGPFGSLPLKRCNSNEKSGSWTLGPFFSLLISKK